MGLPHGSNLGEVCRNLTVDDKPEDVVLDCILGDDGTTFVVFSGEKYGDLATQRHHVKPLLGTMVRVSGISQDQEQALRKLKTKLFGAVPKTEAIHAAEAGIPDGSSVPKKVEPRLSDILEAISGLSIEQRKQVRSALFAPEMSLEEGAMGASKQEVKGAKPSHFSFHMGAMPNPVVSTPHYHMFHFGFLSLVNNIKVSTFSGTPKDSSFDQFIYDVQCLYSSRISKGMILTAIKRSIKGQAQEIVLHMGESASVTDILGRFKMMFGNVSPPHVLLARFYAAEQGDKESITEWYSRSEDLASKITRKDASVISPDNYDIVINIQFWTKLINQKSKDALRHKFDQLAGSPQFIMEARKIETEFSMQTVRVHQLDTGISLMVQKGFDEILARLSSLEDRLRCPMQPEPTKVAGSTPPSFQSRNDSQK